MPLNWAWINKQVFAGTGKDIITPSKNVSFQSHSGRPAGSTGWVLIWHKTDELLGEVKVDLTLVRTSQFGGCQHWSTNLDRFRFVEMTFPIRRKTNYTLLVRYGWVLVWNKTDDLLGEVKVDLIERLRFLRLRYRFR